ncbi:alpha/beta fold hydrolase, partial [Streptomyces sp. NPDC059233]
GALARGDRGGAVEVFMTAAVGIPAEYLAPMRADAATWDRLCSVAHTLPYDGAVMGDTMSGRPLSASRWASVRIPVLAVGGGASDPSLQAGARALAELLPTAGHATLEGQTHDVDPAALAPLLTTFFA